MSGLAPDSEVTASAAAASPVKRQLSPQPSNGEVEIPASKRAKVEEEEQNDTAAGSSNGRDATALREIDVGITTYVSPDLIGLEGGVIKQRFSDFHVFEVAPDGTVCHITHLRPTPASEGGTGLAEQLVQAEAEEADATGELRAARQAEQETERKAKREAAEKEKQKEAEKSWAWSEAVNAEAEAKLNDIIGAEATTALKEMYEKGPPPPNNDNRGRGRGGGASAASRPQASVMSAVVSSKEQRTAVHQLLRSIFEGRFSSEAVEPDVKKPAAKTEDDEDALANAAASSTGDQVKKEDGTKIRIQWSSNVNRTRQDKDPEARKAEQAAQPPPYIHFLLQKTNRDSQDAINILGRSLNLGGNSGHFSKALNDLAFAGTKDKRAVTVQRISLRRGRKTLDDVWRSVNGVGKEKEGPNGGRMGQRGGRGGARGKGGYVGAQGGERKTLLDAMRNRGERGIRIAHLKYADEPLFLGDLGGNEFVITLRNVKVTSEEVIARSVEVLRTKGFINYFGMQRFGSSSVSTHHVGIFIFKRDFHQAVQGVMAPRAGDMEEADAGRQAYSEGRYEDALKLFPRGCTPERALLEKMKRDLTPDGKHKNDWQGYFGNIPKMVRLMYIHAYQSCVWNKIASQRVVRFGLDAPIVGDVVSLDDFDGGVGEGDEMVDDGEPHDEIPTAASSSDAPEASKRSGKSKKKPPMRVHVVTQEDVDARKYSIHDVVIPIPGVSVSFAAGWMTDLYEALLAEDDLTPAHITDTKLPEYTLHGAYRKLLHVPLNLSYSLIRYSDTNINLAQTDEDKLLDIDVPPASDPDAPFQALQLRFTLGTAAYATMALREILKQDTGTANQRLQTEMGEDRRKFVPSIAGGSLKDVNKVTGAKVRSWGAPSAPKPDAVAPNAAAAVAPSESAPASESAKLPAPATTEVSWAFKREMEKLRAEHALQNGTPLDPEEAEEAAYNASKGQ